MFTVDVRSAEDDETRSGAREIWNAVYPQMAHSEADQRDYESWCVEHVDLVAYADGAPIGSGFAAIEPPHAEQGAVRADVAVLPAQRRRGVGSALYGRISAWAAERGRMELETWVVDTDPDGGAFASRRGFAEVVREQLVALDLAGLAEPAVDPPAGVEIVTLERQPGLEVGMYAVALEAFPDIPGQEDEPIEPYEQWVKAYLRSSGDRAYATWVALAGGEVVGYAKFHLSDARPGVALHDITAVKRAWRGRGVAGALKRAEIAWAVREGYERLETANELRNAPIRTLNERLGYRPIPGRALLRGPVTAAS